MAYTPIPPYTGGVPNRGQAPAVFAQNADDWLAYQQTFTNGVDAAGVFVNNAATSAAASEAAALAYKNSAANSEASAAASANFKGAWSSLTGALNKPATVLHNGCYWELLNNLPDVTTSQPGVSADWAFKSGTRWRLAGSSTTANKNEQVIVKSATQIDITLAASVSSGDFFVIANSSESGSAIRIVNAGYTIKTVAGSIPSTDNIILARGETAHFVATSSTILEAV